MEVADLNGFYIEKDKTLKSRLSETFGNYNGLTIIASTGGTFIGAVLLISGYGVKPTVISDTTAGHVGPNGTSLKVSTDDGTAWGKLQITNITESDINFSLIRINMKGY